MHETVLHKNLPILLGTIQQEAGTGELVLEQNDGGRRLCFRKGELIHLRSEATGEQFGSYLLRQGILDLPSLNELLVHGGGRRIGEMILQTGMLSLKERNDHLRALQEQIMIRALEQEILHWSWRAGFLERDPAQASRFQLPYRQILWRTFQEADYLGSLLPILSLERGWTWEGRLDLLTNLDDLPLTPAMAYALSFLGAEPIGFETFRFLSGLGEAEAGRFVATFWALGCLVRVSEGKTLESAHLAPPLPLIMPPPDAPFGPPRSSGRDPFLEWDPLDDDLQPEFLDPDGEEAPPPLPLSRRPPELDLPPCGPRPPARMPPSRRPPELDLPPCGPRPPARTPPAPMPPAEDAPLFAPSLPPALPPPDFPEPLLPFLDPLPPELPAPTLLPQQVDARMLLGRARRQVKLGRTVEAVHTLEEAVDLQPDDETAYEAWLLLGRLRMVNPAWSMRAIHALQNAALICAREAAPWATMGEVYHRRGSEAEARTCFRKALELDPSVAIPADVDLRETPSPPPPATPPRKGLFDSLRHGRKDKP